jgi:hypothetical protein
MGDSDRMLSCAEASARGIDPEELNALRHRGLAIQCKIQKALNDCSYVEAIAQYNELLPIVSGLERMKATGLPAGLALQILRRGIELAEYALSRNERKPC